MIVANQIQILTPEQQQRCHFAVVSTNQTMADGTRQNNSQAMVRLRNGAMAYVRDLPTISNTNPQPNGDYSIAIDNNHSDDIADQSGVGWLFLGADNSMHLMYCLTTNTAANEIAPLAADGMLQFSTEGYVNNMSDDGEYGDFWITAVAPVKCGNDPGTQSVENNRKGGIMPQEETKNGLDKAAVEELVKNMIAATNADSGEGPGTSNVLGQIGDLLEALGITDAQWIADITSDVLKASAGTPYDGGDAPTVEQADPNAPVATAQSVKGEPQKNGVKSMTVNGFQPAVGQPMAKVGVEASDKKRNSAGYLEAYGRALLNGMNRPNTPAGDAPLRDYMKKNDISFADTNVSLVPEVIIKQVSELLQSKNNILSHINMMNGVDSFTAASYVNSTSYAKGRARGATGQKAAQTASIKTRVFVAQSLFKYVALPADLVDNNGGSAGSAIVKWVTRELPAKVIRAAEEALLIGGVLNDDGTDYSALNSVVGDVTAVNSAYGTVYTPAAGEKLITSLANHVTDVDLLDTNPEGTGIYLVLSRQKARELLNSVSLGNGDYPANLSVSLDSIAGYLGIDGIIELPWLRPASVESGQNPEIATYLDAYQAMLVNLSAYTGVGELTPESLSQYFLRANTYDFESKLRVGGGLASPRAAVLVAKNAAA